MSEKGNDKAQAKAQAGAGDSWRVREGDRRTSPTAAVSTPAWALVLLALMAVAVMAVALWGWSLERRLATEADSLQERMRGLEQSQANRQALSQGAFEDIGQSLHAMDENLRDLTTRDAKHRGPQIDRNKQTIDRLNEELEALQAAMTEQGQQLEDLQQQLNAASGETGEGLVSRVAQLSASMSAQTQALEQAAETLQSVSESQKAHDRYRLTTNQALLRLQAQMGQLSAEFEKLREALQGESTVSTGR